MAQVEARMTENHDQLPEWIQLFYKHRKIIMSSLIGLPVLSYLSLRIYNRKKGRNGLREKLIDPESAAATSNHQVKYQEVITDNSIELKFANGNCPRLKI